MHETKIFESPKNDGDTKGKAGRQGRTSNYHLLALCMLQRMKAGLGVYMRQWSCEVYNKQTDSESCTYIVYLPSRKMGETKIHKFLALDVVFFMYKLFLMTSYTEGGGRPQRRKG